MSGVSGVPSVRGVPLLSVVFGKGLRIISYTLATTDTRDTMDTRETMDTRDTMDTREIMDTLYWMSETP